MLDRFGRVRWEENARSPHLRKFTLYSFVCGTLQRLYYFIADKATKPQFLRSCFQIGFIYVLSLPSFSTCTDIQVTVQSHIQKIVLLSKR